MEKDLDKAKVDEGKSDKDKAKARSQRNDRQIVRNKTLPSRLEGVIDQKLSNSSRNNWVKRGAAGKRGEKIVGEPKLPEAEHMNKIEEVKKGIRKKNLTPYTANAPTIILEGSIPRRPSAVMGGDKPKEKQRKLSPSQKMVINSKSSSEPSRQNTDKVAQQAGIAAAKKRRDEYRKQGVLKSGESYNDMKKSEKTEGESLEKSGTASKLAIAAMLAGPIVTKGTLFDGPHQEVTRSIASQPAHEMTDEDNGKHEAVKHVVSDNQPYKITHVVKEKAESVKDKLKTIRNQIKGMDDGTL